MKKVILLLLFYSIGLFAQVVDKRTFDLEKPSIAKISGTTTGVFDYVQNENNLLQATLISGGYFTIGTVNGKSDNKLDDNCNLTYGHPFAKTSYPVFSIDGSWYKFDEYFRDPADMNLVSSGDTLKISATKPGILTIEFMLINDEEDSGIEYLTRVTNEDTIPHQFGTGLVIDPALGKWGDGVFEYNGKSVIGDTLIADVTGTESLKIWERNGLAKGIGLKFELSEKLPDQFVISNWPDIYQNHSPEFEENPMRGIYDLAIKLTWYEKEILPSAVVESRMSILLTDPEFASVAFIRWDLPFAFSMENNELFPRDFKSFVEIINQNEIDISNGELQLTLGTGIKASKVSYSVNAAKNQSQYINVPLESQLVYENQIVELDLELIQNGQTLDVLKRNVLLPAMMLTDTGLVIVDDSLSTASFPNVEFIFGVEVDETGQKVLNLQPENIFLYENDKRIHDFELGKFSVGGSNLADIVFVLDCSGSMGDDIEKVRSNLNEFADSLVAKGYDFRIGVVTFSTTVDDVWDFTDDVEQVKSNLVSIDLWGGIENSPAALYKATELSWRPDSRRTIIWITDEAYPEDLYTKKEVVDRMLMMGISVNGIGLTELQTDWFNPIVLPTGGSFYNITGNFRDIMLDVTNFESQYIYSLKYECPNPESESNEIKLEIHYAGLGVIKNIQYTTSGQALDKQVLSCYPNPFNPEVTFRVDQTNFIDGYLAIYNILGQQVKKIPLSAQTSQKLVWNAVNEQGQQVVSGFYIVKLSLKDASGKSRNEFARILYLK
jgi:Mg-chelatase subunit ChlD